MRKIIIALFLIIPGISLAGDKQNEIGMLQLGLRSTVSLFSHGGYVGTGSGGQFRLRFSKELNTEWFADFLLSDFGNAGRRTDGHIGWSVMFYPFKTEEKKILPYIIAGHCFDYTKITPFNSITNLNTDKYREKWSSAVQFGLGTQFKLKDIGDIALKSQYMMHLGNKDLDAEIQTVNGENTIVFRDDSHGTSLEGHLLVTLSFNINICELW